MNDKRSYTEYTVTTATTDFVIGFDDYDDITKDTVVVTVNGVLAESQGYAVMRKNAQVITITPAVQSGTVRLERVTDIDESFHQFTAGALFSAKSVDENFEQVRHSQQEVRDGFEFLEFNTNGVISDAKAATDRANAAAELAENTDVVQLQTDLNLQKFDTGITATPKFGGVTRTQAAKNIDTLSVEDFGAIGDGVTDDTSALQKAFNSGKVVKLTGGNYLYTQIIVNNPLRLVGKGTLKYSGLAGTGVSTSITFNSSVVAQNLVISTEGTADLIYNLAIFKSDAVYIQNLQMDSSVQRNERGGSEFYGSQIYIDTIRSNNIARPVAFTNESGLGANLELWRNDVHVGRVIATTYLRGIKFRYINNLSLGAVHLSGAWGGVTPSPGFNGVLNESVKNASYGNMYIADATEHAFRFGCPVGSSDWSIGTLFVKDSGGSAFKIAPTPPYKVINGTVGSITGSDIGKGSLTGNSEVVRLSSLDNVTIGSIIGLIRGTRTLAMADVKNLRIGTVYGENMSARIVEFDMGQDMTSGDCANVHIGKVLGTCASTARNAISAYYQGGRSIDNLHIGEVSVSGYSTAVVGLENTAITNSSININLQAGAVAVPYEKLTSATGVSGEVTSSAGKYLGKPINTYSRGTLTVDSPKMITLSSSEFAGLYVSSISVPSAKEALGGWIGFSRLGTSRRAAGIAVIQTDTADTKNGLAFYTQNNSTTANEAVQMSMQLKHNGTMNLPQLPTSAAGLVAGDIYREAGVLKIV